VYDFLSTIQVLLIIVKQKISNAYIKQMKGMMVNAMTDFKEVFNRLESLGITTQRTLGESLGITQSAVSDAKKKGEIPPQMGRGIEQEV